MSLKLGDLFPDFKAETSDGYLNSFHEWVGSSWAILFSHPADFTPVCTTELGRAVQLYTEFKKRNVKLIALSCDTTDSHRGWIPDILHLIISRVHKMGGVCDRPDKKLKLSILYPATTGRNFDEILRVVDSLQLTALKKVATPVDWKASQECMVVPTLSTQEATQLFGDTIRQLEVPSDKNYLRFTQLKE
uniref:Thioredoxin domain-containing protein n=1 Tax=Ditylenchus dipsaci TaxID=166011 RepID=A0A915D3Q1_9BILA